MFLSLVQSRRVLARRSPQPHPPGPSRQAPLSPIRGWRRQVWLRAIAFLLGLCLVLSFAPATPAQAAREIRWEDLLPPQATAAADPFAAMTPDQLADLARAEYLRWWLANDGESRDGGAIDPAFQRQRLGELEQKLTEQGLDVDYLLAEVTKERDRRQSSQALTNPSLEGQAVQLPGYALPLDPNNPRELQAFLLVPYVGACIHVPTPPPNQIVFVEAPEGIKNPGTFSPVKITGKLQQSTRTYDLFRVDGSQPVTVGYSLRLDKMTPYRPEGESLLPRMEDLGLPEGHNNSLRGRAQGLQVWASASLGRTMTHIQEQRSLSALALGSLLAFGYGVLHTLGPGHGKAVIISYFVGQGGSLRRGLTMGVRVAIFHVFSAVLVAVATDVIVRQALGSAPGSYVVVRLVSYGAIAAIGFWMLKQATETEAAIASPATGPATGLAINPANGSLALSPSLSGAILNGDQRLAIEQERPLQRPLQHRASALCGCVGCGDGSMAGTGGWLSMAIGAVPCSGALLVLVYGLANDLLWASLVMVMAISLGMAVTLAAIGMGAIWGRERASQHLGNAAQQQRRSQWLRLFAACAVLVMGTFMFGLTLASALG
ncbi:MAG: DUF3299 domain-containing protein [Synechococcales cyanobacterium RM1_1_8]|nr:DUF3299 domain-containing protein [Synechococcales cyanobacterium RM1_1_8]